MPSVPNTNTFNLLDVYNSVHGHASGTQQNLQSCFENATSAYFDANYNNDSFAPANSMLRFRNYTPIVDQSEITVNNVSRTTARVDCIWWSSHGFILQYGATLNTYSGANAIESDFINGDGTMNYLSGGRSWVGSLIPNTTYYSRVCYKTETGTYYGPEISFTTLP